MADMKARAKVEWKVENWGTKSVACWAKKKADWKGVWRVAKMVAMTVQWMGVLQAAK